MTLDRDFNLREIAGQYMLIAEGVCNISMNAILSLNESAAWLWRRASEESGEFTEEDMVEWMLSEYDAPREVLVHDVHEMVKSWIEYGIIRK